MQTGHKLCIGYTVAIAHFLLWLYIWLLLDVLPLSTVMTGTLMMAELELCFIQFLLGPIDTMTWQLAQHSRSVWSIFLFPEFDSL